jgi:hypothetical protein
MPGIDLWRSKEGEVVGVDWGGKVGRGRGEGISSKQGGVKRGGG